MDVVSRRGRTSTVYRLREGLVCKSPCRVDNELLLAEFENAFAVEKQLLEMLGHHPRISLQVAEAVAYIHNKGIIHSNLNTTNVFVHQAHQSLDLILADFGGSKCNALGLNGHLLPDEPFFDTQLKRFDTPKVDMFGLGVLLYITNAGHYPFHERVPQDEERFKYEAVRSLFERETFPELSGVLFENVIAGCCIERRFETAEGVVVALKAERDAMHGLYGK
ncbi:kinase-like domain-containing protein [Phaeosphaeriaceae sp. PMI808]|nr:kinase-like domain-containing protein [Phaeosphaeriaceae sp. PMI808]